MKKFFKGCFITALICLVLGVALVVVVTLVGDKEKIAEEIYNLTDGKVEMHMDSWDDFGIHISGDWEGRYDINEASVFDENYEVWEGDVKKKRINQEEVDSLEIDVGGNSLEVKLSEDEFYYIEQQGEGKLQAYEENRAIYIKAIVNKVSGGKEGPKLILYVPADADLEKINVELGAGTVVVSELNAKTVEIDLGAGYLEWKALNADSLLVDIDAGKVVVKDGKLGDLEVDCAAGDCQVQGELQGNVKVECAAGNVSLSPVGKETEFNYDLKCTVGSIQVGDVEVSEMNETKKMDNGAYKTMELSVSAGNIEVEFE